VDHEAPIRKEFVKALLGGFTTFEEVGLPSNGGTLREDVVAGPIAPTLSRSAIVNRPGSAGGQHSRRIARYGTDTKEENLEAVFT